MEIKVTIQELLKEDTTDKDQVTIGANELKKLYIDREDLKVRLSMYKKENERLTANLTLVTNNNLLLEAEKEIIENHMPRTVILDERV